MNEIGVQWQAMTSQNSTPRKTECLARCVKFSAIYILKYFSYFSKKTEFDRSCNLSPGETLWMKCQILFSGPSPALKKWYNQCQKQDGENRKEGITPQKKILQFWYLYMSFKAFWRHFCQVFPRIFFQEFFRFLLKQRKFICFKTCIGQFLLWINKTKFSEAWVHLPSLSSSSPLMDNPWREKNHKLGRIYCRQSWLSLFSSACFIDNFSSMSFDVFGNVIAFCIDLGWN